MDCNIAGFSDLHYPLEFAQTQVYLVDDAIQPFHPLLPPSPSAFILSQHRVFANKSVLHIGWPEYWSFSFSISPSNEYSGLISFRFYLLAVQGPLKSLLQHHKESSSAVSLLYSPTHTSVHDYWKNHSFDYMDLCCQREAFAFQYPV